MQPIGRQEQQSSKLPNEETLTVQDFEEADVVVEEGNGVNEDDGVESPASNILFSNIIFSQIDIESIFLFLT